jgi:hypothetical protein
LTIHFYRRHVLGFPLFSLLVYPAAAQMGGARRGGPSCTDFPNHPCPNPPFPDTVRPLKRYLVGDRERNLKDLAQLGDLVQQRSVMIDKADPTVVSVPILRNSDEMRKLAQKVGARLQFDYGK